VELHDLKLMANTIRYLYINCSATSIWLVTSHAQVRRHQPMPQRGVVHSGEEEDGPAVVVPMMRGGSRCGGGGDVSSMVAH
jgi:hypothetical protein